MCFASAGLSGGSSGAVGGVPARRAGFGTSLMPLTEFPDFRPEQRPQREKTSGDSGTKSSSQRDTLGPQVGSGDAEMKPQTFNTSPPSYKSSQEISSRSQGDFVGLSARVKKTDWILLGGDSSKADGRLESVRQSQPFFIQEAPVREEKQTDWSMTNNDSNTGARAPRPPYPGRKDEPVTCFSVNTERGALGALTPDASDLTVYKEIPKQTALTENAQANKRLVREPIPGSECESEREVCSRPLFSELRQRQQDSGFDSPFYQQT